MKIALFKKSFSMTKLLAFCLPVVFFVSGCGDSDLFQLVKAANAQTVPISTSKDFIRISNVFASNDAVLYSPVGGDKKVALIYTHPFAATTLVGFFCDQLPIRGYAVLCFNNRYTNNQQLNTIWEPTALDIASAVTELRTRGYQKVYLIGYSAGGPTMAYYQALAEKGNAIFNSGNTLSGFKGFFNADKTARAFPPSDGLIFVNPSSGVGASGMFRLDGSIIDEENGTKDPSLDMYSSANGFDAVKGTGTYTKTFLQNYYVAQCNRMNKLIESSQKRLEIVKSGKGRFVDDELSLTVGLRANPAYVDLSLATTTKGSYLLLPSGEISVVKNERKLNNYSTRNRGVDEAARTDTSFLSYRAVKCISFNPDATTKDEHGLDTKSSNNVTYANMELVNAPTLIIQGNADNTIVHLTIPELIFNSTAAADKSLWFIKGMTHGITANNSSDGDVPGVLANSIASWLKTRN